MHLTLYNWENNIKSKKLNPLNKYCTELASPKHKKSKQQRVESENTKVGKLYTQST